VGIRALPRSGSDPTPHILDSGERAYLGNKVFTLSELSRFHHCIRCIPFPFFICSCVCFAHKSGIFFLIISDFLKHVNVFTVLRIIFKLSIMFYKNTILMYKF
jgi:hypothetical protein